MASNDVGKIFVQECVVGFGLFGGMGVDPEGMILKALSPYVMATAPHLSFIIWLIPIISFVISFALTFFLGGVVGFGAVGMAALGGYLLTNPSGVGIWLVAISVIIGLFAPYAREKIGF
ncbi:MAG TPA: hypothetical protein VJ771_05720 [Candidatus Nitrosotalea sp.]|nr:hypothetical protein [Candidatus Nitrosotalea sp.]